MPKASDPRPCRDETCGIRIIFARRAGTTRWGAYEAQDRPPFSQAAMGAFVIVADQAWKPSELIEEFRTRGEGMSESAARELVSGFPFHRTHHHEPAETPTTTPKEHQPA
jgi:hypothetical protein